MTQERRALYPGSFDPPTNGHKWVIERVADQYDKGLVAIGINPEKAGRFPVSEREEMLREIASEFPNIFVTTYLGLYQADVARMVGANYVVRGTRNSADYDYKSDNSHINTTINPDLETIVIIPPKELLQVSSSMVMGLMGFEGWKTEVTKMVPEPVFRRLEVLQDKRDKEQLKKRFQSLCERLHAQGNPPELFEDLWARHSEKDRLYHNVAHIKMCLNELDLARHLADDPDAIEFALWFHDAVYNSNKQDQSLPDDDESESAGLAQEGITQLLVLPQEFGQKVGSLILATKHSETPKDIDHQLMVDIDLAILGRSIRLYDIYEQNVRTEYGWVPQEQFTAARIRILKSFLDDRDSIYSTKFFFDRYEEQAEFNLNRSIQKLSV